ncbi:ABC transporter substrate-binding protein [Actinoplanes subtropicus]|uniref:ABC transporter substrate-binding protein n=1 Tax=Actinoplanes subtropicus TaxID=543632 RepID=UPI0012FBF315|nr:extracellular solute-binding protein [Actinoplanes subtropicus]
MVSRRNILGVGAAALAACAGCSRGAATQATDGEMRLWCWPGGLSDKVLAAAKEHFAGQARLTVKIIDGDYKQQMVSALDQGHDIPAIAGIKGEDIASLLPRADRFTDLNTLGAADVRGDYLPWKWQQGSTIDGQLIGFPIDIGPNAMFYRPGLFKKAGLPTAPAAVSEAIPDWPAFLEVGSRFVKAVPGVAFVASGTQVFSVCLGQGTKRFVDEGNHFIGDEAHIRRAWDFAVGVSRKGLGAAIQSDNPKWGSGIAQGKFAVDLGAAWHALDIEQAAPATRTAWRVAAASAAGANSGGSFLAIPAAATRKDLAMTVIKWLLSPANQAAAFGDVCLFPSTPAAYGMPALTAPDAFFGNQRTIDVFGPSAQKVHHVYEAPADAALADLYLKQLILVEAGKDPKAGWHDAVAAAQAMAVRLGVN